MTMSRHIHLAVLLSLTVAATCLLGCSSSGLSGSSHVQDPKAKDGEPAPASAPSAAPASEPAAAKSDSSAGASTPPALTFTLPNKATVPPATAAVYANTNDDLYTVDQKSGAATKICSFNIDGKATLAITDIAINSAGALYGIAANGVYAVNPLTCAMTLAVVQKVRGAVGLTFLSDGTLIIAGDGITALNPNTKVETPMVAAGKYQTSGDIIALPDHKLYWAVVTGEQSPDAIIVVDPATGATSRLGDSKTQAIFGLGYADGVLLGFSQLGRVFPLSMTTGSAAPDLKSSSPSWSGATTNPVLWK